MLTRIVKSFRQSIKIIIRQNKAVFILNRRTIVVLGPSPGILLEAR